MNTWEPKKPELVEDKLKAENRYLAKNKIDEEKTIYFVESDDRLKIQKKKPKQQLFIIYHLEMREDGLLVSPRIQRLIDKGNILTNSLDSDNSLNTVEPDKEEYLELKAREFQQEIEVSEDVAEKRYIQQAWFEELINLKLEGSVDRLHRIRRIEKSSGFFYKKAQDFLMSSSISERTEILEELSSRI